LSGSECRSEGFDAEFRPLQKRTRRRWMSITTQHLSVPLVPEDGVAHSEFGTFERTRGDTNGHQLGHQNGHHLHKSGVHWPEETHKDTGGHRFCARSCSILIQQGFRSVEGLTQWLPEAVRLVNQLKRAEICHEAVLWFSLNVV
jgi:hypothetical protein